MKAKKEEKEEEDAAMEEETDIGALMESLPFFKERKEKEGKGP